MPRRGPPAAPSARRRLLVAAMAVTVLVALLDASASAWTSRLRMVGEDVFGSALASTRPAADETSRLRAENTRLAVELQRAEDAGGAAAALGRLLADPTLAGARLVGARVVAVGAQGAAGPQRVTLDVGARDGIRTGLTVVAAAGLVGRTVAVTPWTCDVLLIGAPSLDVAVRVGTRGTLGLVQAVAAGGADPRSPGELNLAAVETGTIVAGDVVTTMGSPGGSPFVPGIRVGVVASVDAAAGRLTPTAAVRPAVDVSALDVVAVLLSAPRATPRPTATAGPP